VLQGDTLVVQGKESDWTTTLTTEYNKLGLNSYTWTQINGVDDAVAKSENNFIDLIRYYEGHGTNYEAKINYKDTVSVSTYGYGLTATAMKAIGNYDDKNKKVINKPDTQAKAYEQLLKYLNNVTLPETKTYLGDIKYDELPQGIKAALLDYHFKNGYKIMSESSLKSKLQTAKKTDTAADWAAVLKELVYTFPASSKAEKKDNPGLHRRSLSRVILAAKDLKKKFKSAEDKAIIDNVVKEIYDAGVKCAKDNNIGTTDFDRIYNSYAETSAPAQVKTPTIVISNPSQSKYKVPSQMGLFSAANAMIPDNAAIKNGVDAIELRKTVINEIIRINNIPTDGVDGNGYPKVRLLEQGEELTLPTTVKLNGKTITLQVPDGWEITDDVKTDKKDSWWKRIFHRRRRKETIQEEVANENKSNILRMLDEFGNENFSFIDVNKQNLNHFDFYHKIEKGETLWKFANKYNINIETLKKYNRLDSDIIKEGDNITIPKIVYITEMGDTVDSLSKKFGINADVLRGLNSLSSEDNKLPYNYSLEFPGYPYIVQKKDNLIQIAKRAGVSIESILMVNDIPSPDKIQENQKLIIPFNNADYNLSDTELDNIKEQENYVTSVSGRNEKDYPYYKKHYKKGQVTATRYVWEPTVQGTLSGKTIIINPGHGYNEGGHDPGASNKNCKYTESEITYKNAIALSDMLRAQGAKVIFIQGGVNLARKAIKNETADMMISLHVNSSSAKVMNDDRLEVYYNSNYTSGKKLAEGIESRIDEKHTNKDYAQTKSANHAVTRAQAEGGRSDTPSVLVELGFINNPQFQTAVNANPLRTEAINAIYNEILNYKF